LAALVELSNLVDLIEAERSTTHHFDHNHFLKRCGLVNIDITLIGQNNDLPGLKAARLGPR